MHYLMLVGSDLVLSLAVLGVFSAWDSRGGIMFGAVGGRSGTVSPRDESGTDFVDSCRS